MEETSPAATDVEDKETYEMILAKQAADENAVDADGKLIGEEERKKCWKLQRDNRRLSWKI